MTNLTRTAMRPAIVLALLGLWVSPPVFAAAGSSLDDEVSKQLEIYKSRGEDVPEGYVIGRSLLSYIFTLPSSFSASLASLGPKDRWLDVGAGEGRAILDYSTSRYEAMYAKGAESPSKKAQAVAMSIEDRRTVHWHQTAASLEPNQIQYLFGKRLREYSLAELGKFQLITDVLGGFSYSRYLSIFMEKALEFLEVNGSLYTVLQDIRSEHGTNRPFYPGASFLTEIVNPDGSEVRICTWLKRIACVEVSCEFKAQRVPPIEAYRIHKVCDDVKVPHLELIHFQAGTPPERRFRLGNSAELPVRNSTPR